MISETRTVFENQLDCCEVRNVDAGGDDDNDDDSDNNNNNNLYHLISEFHLIT